MAKYSKQTFYRKTEDRLIYAFVSPTDKAFYIGHCLSESLDETYRHHSKGRRYFSRALMESIYPRRPCMFVLEETPRCTIPKAYVHILVWIRILTENGYTCFNPQETIEQSQDLFYEQNKRYEERKNHDLSALLSCEKCVKPTYRKQTCERHSSYIPPNN